jgi:glycosyltransferase involved in cell wall biosynthesis
VKILIDVTNQRSGGGVQVALGTMLAMREVRVAAELSVLALRGSYPASLANQLGYELYTTVDSRLGRLLRQLFGARRACKRCEPDAVYTIFGPPLRRVRAKAVVGVAYSNLFYPELDFWAGANARRRAYYRLRDRLRLRRLLTADGFIFETEAIRRRAVEQHELDPTATIVIPPAVSPYATNPEDDAKLRNELNRVPAGSRILMLSSANPNKNLDVLPRVARALRDEHGINPTFLLSLEGDDEPARRLALQAEQLDVKRSLAFIGRIEPRSIGVALDRCDIVMLLSNLESFSNNVLEAFASATPLVISDRDWARSACKEAAIYVEPTSPHSVAAGLASVLTNRDTAEGLRRAGTALLASAYKSQESRAVQIFEFIEQIVTHQ